MRSTTAPPHMVRDNNKCILCRRCVAACDKISMSASSAPTTAASTPSSAAPFDKTLDEIGLHLLRPVHRQSARPARCMRRTTPTRFGPRWPTRQSTSSCRPLPLSAPRWARCFGMPIGTNVTGKMVAALRRLGFDKVFDTDFCGRPHHHGGGQRVA